MRFLTLATGLVLLSVSAAAAQAPRDVFKDGPKGAKVHAASGFVCPARIGRYVRDAVGESDVETGSDFCAYYARDGVYGTVTLTPLHGTYNPRESLAPQFVEQKGTGGKQVAEKTVTLGTKTAPLSVYTRTYETSRLATLHYRILFTGAAVKNWAVETTIEYAEPRDNTVKQNFFDAVYGDAIKDIGAK